jgi:tRNA 5-methylaminomethyl-2-thiouridine biosynthesis bifunctional protein
MKPNTPWRAVPAANIVWESDHTPRSVEFDDVYYSREDGLAETRHVFLEGNDLPRRWQQHAGHVFTIFETGFGTGLNFLATWQAWRELPGCKPRLHFLSVERFPLSLPDLERAVSCWPGLNDMGTQLAAQYPGLLPGQHRLLFDQGDVVLDLWWADIGEALQDIAGQKRQPIDAWYLDGFAPSRNLAMWTEDVLQAVAALSRPGATFATFTAAGAVRRTLGEAGFSVQKVSGFGRKRDCLRGTLSGSPRPANPAPPAWDLPAVGLPIPAEALVIGAGLAGCSAAQSLARRGIPVTLIDRGELASGASANEQGVLYTRLSRKHSAITDFALQSFRFSSSFYRQLFHEGILHEGVDGQLCGCFQQQDDGAEMAAIADLFRDLPELARVVDIETANRLTGLEQGAAGYWLPGSGWLYPPGVCRALSRHDNITLLENRGRVELEPGPRGWVAKARGATLAEAPCAVIAAGNGSREFAGLDWLPLQAIRGQTSMLMASEQTRRLRSAFCHEGYIAPARSDRHCIGATFDLRDHTAEPRPADNEDNLARLAAAVPGWAEALAAVDPVSMPARVGFRCASPDYLPLAGRVPERDAFLRTFAGLRQNARRTIPREGRYMHGLYISAGHGSRGLTSAPLAAELLASMICDEPLPVDRDLHRALAPARFLIRDLARNRI